MKYIGSTNFNIGIHSKSDVQFLKKEFVVLKREQGIFNSSSIRTGSFLELLCI